MTIASLEVSYEVTNAKPDFNYTDEMTLGDLLAFPHNYDQ